MDWSRVIDDSRLNVRSASHAPRHAAPAAPSLARQPAVQAEDLSQRLELVHVVEGAAHESDAPSSAPLTGLSLAAGYAEQQKNSPQPTDSTNIHVDVNSVRLEKRRARNRASQRRSRQKHRVRTFACCCCHAQNATSPHCSAIECGHCSMPALKGPDTASSADHGSGVVASAGVAHIFRAACSDDSAQLRSAYIDSNFPRLFMYPRCTISLRGCSRSPGVRNAAKR